jgi:hypothetical protein
MKFLVDTNVIIPLEPTNPSEQEALTATALQVASRAMAAGFQLYRHPATTADLSRDRNRERRQLRHRQFERYPLLPDPPSLTAPMEALLGRVGIGSNDWVDHQLLAALSADAVDFLVTEDRGLLKKGRRAGFGNRILSLGEALILIETLSDRTLSPPPAVRATFAHAIDKGDPILNSFREDYQGFDPWLRKCKLEHRLAWVIGGENDYLAAFCIINPETNPPIPLQGKVLKLCSFKVAELSSGSRFGELLLKAVFEHAFSNAYEWIFVTLFERHEKLLELLEAFGFTKRQEPTNSGEILLFKPLRPGPEAGTIDPLQYHIRHGPRLFRQDVPWYLVPIQPRYSRVLFPETSVQHHLRPGAHSFGNAIRKAYLCHSPIRTITSGSVLVFYQTGTERGLIALGIVEETLVSSSTEQVTRAVAKRTVYSFEEIQELCQSSVLVLLFRQARALSEPIPVGELIQHGVFQRPPQSIVTLHGEGLTCLKNRLAE